MAIIFNHDSFEIKVKTGHDPVESWLDMQNEMIDVLKSEDEQLNRKRPHILELLRNMLPDLDTARKMTK